MNMNLQKMTRIAILGAVAGLLFLIPGIPILVPFYKLDFSSVPVLLGSFALGPVAGLAITLIKDIIGAFTSNSGGIGELADFVMTAALLLPASLMYQRNRTFRTAALGLALGTVLMALAGAVMNYAVLIPLYQKFLPLDQIIAAGTAVIPFIKTQWQFILLITVPFNLIKGVVLCLVTMLLYKRVSPLIKGMARKG